MTLQDTFGYGFVNYFAGLGKKPNTSELLSSNCDYRVEKFGYKIPGGKEIREFFELDEIETKLPEWEERGLIAISYRKPSTHIGNRRVNPVAKFKLTPLGVRTCEPPERKKPSKTRVVRPKPVVKAKATKQSASAKLSARLDAVEEGQAILIDSLNQIKDALTKLSK